jgi:ubiquitin C-terminal hydrolase
MAAAKKAKTNSVVMKIKQKEEELSFIQKELDILKAHKAKLAKVKVVKPKKKKKKKKKNPLDQLGIKL